MKGLSSQEDNRCPGLGIALGLAPYFSFLERRREPKGGEGREVYWSGVPQRGAPAGKVRDGPSSCSGPLQLLPISSCGAARGSGAAGVIGWC